MAAQPARDGAIEFRVLQPRDGGEAHAACDLPAPACLLPIGGAEQRTRATEGTARGAVKRRGGAHAIRPIAAITASSVRFARAPSSSASSLGFASA